jgi:hypothetical protein
VALPALIPLSIYVEIAVPQLGQELLPSGTITPHVLQYIISHTKNIECQDWIYIFPWVMNFNIEKF